MGIFDVLFGGSDEDHEETKVVDTSTGWAGIYPGLLTDEVTEILEENGYAVVEEEDDEEEDKPWWKVW